MISLSSGSPDQSKLLHWGRDNLKMLYLWSKWIKAPPDLKSQLFFFFFFYIMWYDWPPGSDINAWTFSWGYRSCGQRCSSNSAACQKQKKTAANWGGGCNILEAVWTQFSQFQWVLKTIKSCVSTLLSGLSPAASLVFAIVRLTQTIWSDITRLLLGQFGLSVLTRGFQNVTLSDPVW